MKKWPNDAHELASHERNKLVFSQGAVFATQRAKLLGNTPLAARLWKTQPQNDILSVRKVF